ncbi:MAG: hypothetical protein J5897_01885 [Candidatus Methanomethylophilus sp.]|nr:hypothetical protein [Methanomethylophilus sp.]
MAYNIMAAAGAIIFIMGLFFLNISRQNRNIKNRTKNITHVELYGSIACIIGLIVCVALAIWSML